MTAFEELHRYPLGLYPSQLSGQSSLHTILPFLQRFAMHFRRLASFIVFRLLQAGAAGYLLKNVHSQELVAAVRSVSQGESVLHPTIARKVLDRFLPNSSGKSSSQQNASGLSDREMDFLKLMARGLSNKEIAGELSISIRTVQGHLRQIFKKLGVGSRTEAVVYALKEGLVTLDNVPRGEPVGK